MRGPVEVMNFYLSSWFFWVPDPLFDDAEALARRLHVSRSELYANALRAFVAQHDEAAKRDGSRTVRWVWPAVIVVIVGLPCVALWKERGSAWGAGHRPTVQIAEPPVRRAQRFERPLARRTSASTSCLRRARTALPALSPFTKVPIWAFTSASAWRCSWL